MIVGTTVVRIPTRAAKKHIVIGNLNTIVIGSSWIFIVGKSDVYVLHFRTRWSIFLPPLLFLKIA